jgi:hypothetical protein
MGGHIPEIRGLGGSCEAPYLENVPYPWALRTVIKHKMNIIISLNICRS